MNSKIEIDSTNSTDSLMTSSSKRPVTASSQGDAEVVRSVRFGRLQIRGNIQAAICMGLCLYLVPQFPLTRFTEPVYQEWGFWKRMGYQYMADFTARWKYYFIWSISESSIIISGLGFSGWTNSSPPKPRWDRAKNVDILGVELAKSSVQRPLVWNIQLVPGYIIMFMKDSFKRERNPVSSSCWLHRLSVLYGMVSILGTLYFGCPCLAYWPRKHGLISTNKPYRQTCRVVYLFRSKRATSGIIFQSELFFHLPDQNVGKKKVEPFFLCFGVLMRSLFICIPRERACILKTSTLCICVTLSAYEVL